MADITAGYDAAGSALDYSTIAAAVTAAAASGDRIIPYYSNVYKGLTFFETVAVTGKDLTILGGLPNCQVTIHKVAANAITVNNATTLVVENLTLMAQTGYYVAGVAAGATSFTARRCRLSGGTACVYARVVTRLEACEFSNSNIAAYMDVTTCDIVNCTARNMRQYGYQRVGGTITSYNSIGISCAYGAYYGTIGGSNNATDDGTGPATGLVDLRSTDGKFLFNSSYACPNDTRVLTNSPLLGAGVNTDYATQDIDGNTISSGSVPIGCSNGCWLVDPNYVLNTHTPAGNASPELHTADEVISTATYPGNWNVNNLTTNNVKDGVAFGLSQEGEYSLSSAAPGAPTITGIKAESGKVTITVEAAAETDIVYLLYREMNGNGNWSEEDSELSVTGSGDIEVTGLDDAIKYEYIAYSNNAGIPGRVCSPVYAEALTVGSGLPSPFVSAELAAMIVDLWRLRGLDSANPVVATGDGIASKTLETADILVTITDGGITRAE